LLGAETQASTSVCTQTQSHVSFKPSEEWKGYVVTDKVSFKPSEGCKGYLR